ncbi:MAG: phosphoribosylaminoimidazolesuccinocarboxamide synthase, partial [Candidatus Omnitrophica bacterium]|nr:phosphoribosylaminoimidazolesuccinocarboxamide synthase [Candidatus Omnitrophota bacterium]
MSHEVSQPTVKETRIDLPLVSRGKVRDIYAVGEDRLLIVTTDRLSAFDVVLPNPIPDKGRVLNQISLYWFKQFESIVPNHLITDDVDRMNLPGSVLQKHAAGLRGRSGLAHKAKPLPVECVVRGYLAGSGWKDYLKTGAVCGHKLPEGLKQCDRLPEPLFTPSTKATVGHDENISVAEAEKLTGGDVARQAESLSKRLYLEGARIAETRGIMIADTKFEFGLLDGKLILIDEV